VWVGGCVGEEVIVFCRVYHPSELMCSLPPETVFGGALSQYPLIVRQPSPLTVDVGHRAVLECRAEGAVVFDWYKDGKPFRKGARDGRLVFEKVRLEDGGEYQCAVVNDRAEVKSSIAKLTVGTLLVDCRYVVG